jgi:DNA helicase HerA-like ATPase
MRRACVFAFGKTGSGKTYFLRNLVRRAPRLLVVDVTGDYAELHCRTVTAAGDVAAAFRAAGAGPCRIRYAADLHLAGLRSYLRAADRASDIPAGIARMGPAAAAVAFATGDVVLVLDELSFWCRPGITPEPLALVATMGRHRGVSLLGGAQRPALVSRLVTSQRDVAVFFRLTEPIDLDYAREQLGDAARRIPQLAVGQGLAAGDMSVLEILGAPTQVKSIETSP